MGSATSSAARVRTRRQLAAEWSSSMMRHQMTAAIGIVVVSAVAAVAQSPARAGYKAPRTAWGDPDISGNYTNKYEQGTPFERPRELEGRTFDQITPAELKNILAAR